MELDNQELQEMHDYLGNKMSVEQRKQYETKLATNPELKKELAVQRDLKNGLQFLHLKEKYKDIHNIVEKKGYLNDDSTESSETEVRKLPTGDTSQEVKDRSPFIIVFVKRYAVACAILLAVGLGWLGINRYQNHAQNQLAFENAFIKTPKANLAISAETDVLGASREKIMADSIAITNAINSIASNEPSKAIATLEKYGSDGSYWNETARWYLAMAYLKSNDRAAATKILEELAQKELYKAEAEKILANLK